MNDQQTTPASLLGLNDVELTHHLDWEDVGMITLAIFVAVVFGIIVGHSILKSI